MPTEVQEHGNVLEILFRIKGSASPDIVHWRKPRSFKLSLGIVRFTGGTNTKDFTADGWLQTCSSWDLQTLSSLEDFELVD